MGGFKCADSTSCETFCTMDGDCASTSDYCSLGQCIPKNSVGPCTANDECSSGICGTTGTGNCCNAMCATGGVCGATGCDGSGACAYPLAGTACGAGPSCNGTVFTAPGACDGLGTCAGGTATDCAASGNVCDSVLGCVQCVTDFDCLAVNDAGVLTCMNNTCQ
jgi:hypothetical protein